MKLSDPGYNSTPYEQHWYASHAAAIPDVTRGARLALEGSRLPQVVHGHHEGGTCRDRSNHSECFTLRYPS